MKSFTTQALALTLGAIAVVNSGCGKDIEASKRAHVERGDRYAQRKQYKEAVIEYRAAVKDDPKFGQARFKLAEAYLAFGDERNAYGEAIRGADLLSDNVDAQVLAIKMLLRAGSYTDAKTRTETLLTNQPRNVTAPILLANALAGLKEFDQAMQELERAIELDPTNETAYEDLATLRAATGDREGAEAIFKKAVEVAPRSVDAHLALANYYRTMGRLQEAEALLKRARALDPNQLVAIRALAVFYMSTKRQPEAEPYLKKIVELTQDGESRMTLADYYAAAGRRAEARVLLEGLAKNRESFAEATTRLAALEVSDGAPAAALKTLERVLAKEPGNATALAMKSRLLLADHKTDDALTQAQNAVKSEPQLPEAQYAAGLAYVAKRDSARAQSAFTEVLKLNPVATAPQLALAQLHIRQNRFEDAAKVTREALRVHPDDASLHLMLVQVLTAQGNLEGAASELRPLLEQFPDNAEVHTRAGMLALSRQDRNRARQSFERALALAPQALEPFGGLVTLDLSDGRTSDARARVDSRLKDQPRDPRLWLLNANLSDTAGDAAGTESALRKAIELDASNLEVYSMLSRLYIRQRKLDNARQELEKVSALQPSDVGAATMVGMILEVQGKRADARQQYERIIATDPNAAVAANNLAWMYAEDETNLAVAVQLAQTALTALPNTPQVTDTAGWVYFKAGLVSRAIPLLERSVNQASQNADFSYHLGMATLQVGDWEKARTLLERALKLNPRLAGAENAKRALRSIQD